MAVDYRSKIVASALSYLGTTAPKGDDQFITAYNKWAGTKFSVDGTPWCAIFVTFNARMVGVPTTIIPNFAGCTTAMSWFKQRGRWHEKGSGYVPKKGDLIMYDWDISGNADHVGIVVDVANGKVNTIEGNTTNNGVYGVWKKSYSLTSKLIRGYAEPDYDGTNTTAVSNQTQLSSMVKATYVKQFQTWMNSNFNQKLAVDGSFGPASKKAVISCWQTQMNTSFKSGLVVDGSFGPLCQAAAEKHVLNQKSKAVNLVYILQGLLYAHGYDPKGFDGSFGPGCLAAVKAFQKARSLTVDGSVGKNTWTSLFNKW
ncbi:MAG: peptidoglycan-binding protein [Muribaculaceae bacterium]|nr:peptidoglycan-binding protein [Muribaculaceae bacterium]